jgi:hypothetical protein
MRKKNVKRVAPVRPSFVREAQFIPRLLGIRHIGERLLEPDTPENQRGGRLVKLPVPLLKQALLRCVERVCRTSRLVRPADGAELVLQFTDRPGSGPADARWDRKEQRLVFQKAPDDWCEAVGELAMTTRQGKKRRAVVSAGSLHGFFQLHGTSAGDPLSRLFTDVYVEANDAVRAAQRKAADGWAERVQRACRQGDFTTASLLMAKTNRNSEPEAPPMEDEDETVAQIPLPVAFQSAVTELAKQRDRFPNGGRAILCSGSGVSLRGSMGPVVGVPVALAMRVTQEEICSEHLVQLVAAGPLRHPGAHYVVEDSGCRRYVPVDGFRSRAEAAEWMGSRVRLVGRHLLDGDLVGITRSPVVVPHNHMYFRVKVVAGFTLRPHDVMLKSMDADFDGDGSRESPEGGLADGKIVLTISPLVKIVKMATKRPSMAWGSVFFGRTSAMC